MTDKKKVQGNLVIKPRSASLSSRLGDRNLEITIEELDSFEQFEHLTRSQKKAMISFVYEMSVIFYNNYQQEIRSNE